MVKALGTKTILVTGATSGMGAYLATQLARQGATVLLHGRSAKSLKRVAADIQAKTGNNRLRTYLADLSSLREVKVMAGRISETEPRLDALINNAGTGGGLIFSKRELSKDGYELRFAVNYLAPYLLTRELLPLLKRSAPARIVNVSSAGQQVIDLSDVMLEQHYSLARAYMQSKLALIMMTFDMAAQLSGTGVTSNALHPATFMNTKMTRRSLIPPTSSVKSGAEPTMRLATAPELEGVTGTYFNQAQEGRAVSQAYDLEARNQLRTLSEHLVERALHGNG
jgi:NAD(P)-dependent dehydrogenase (short-subunit alcohol dehydrogenase family)